MSFGRLVHTPHERFYAAIFRRLERHEDALDIGCGNGQKLILLRLLGLAGRGRVSTTPHILVVRGQVLDDGCRV